MTADSSRCHTTDLPILRFETHYAEDRSKRQPPQNFTPMIGPGERVVSVETFRDGHDDIAARVWIERVRNV